MTKEQFVNLLNSILEERKKNANYTEIYDKCLLGFEMSYEREIYTENKIFSKSEQEIEASDHLKYVLTSLINCYGKNVVVKVLKEL